MGIKVNLLSTLLFFTACTGATQLHFALSSVSEKGDQCLVSAAGPYVSGAFLARKCILLCAGNWEQTERCLLRRDASGCLMDRRFLHKRRQHYQCQSMLAEVSWSLYVARSTSVQSQKCTMASRSLSVEFKVARWTGIVQTWGCRLWFGANSRQKEGTQGSYMKLYIQCRCIAHFFRIPSGPGLGCPASQHLWPLFETIRASCRGPSVTGNWRDQTREEAWFEATNGYPRPLNICCTNFHTLLICCICTQCTHTDTIISQFNHVPAIVYVYIWTWICIYTYVCAYIHAYVLTYLPYVQTCAHCLLWFGWS